MKERKGLFSNRSGYRLTKSLLLQYFSKAGSGKLKETVAKATGNYESDCITLIVDDCSFVPENLHHPLHLRRQILRKSIILHKKKLQAKKR